MHLAASAASYPNLQRMFSVILCFLCGYNHVCPNGQLYIHVLC